MPVPPNIDDDTLYQITVLRPVVLDPPMNQVIMTTTTDNVIKGKVLKTLNAADIDTVSEFTPPPG
jgi:hypothetical protein